MLTIAATVLAAGLSAVAAAPAKPSPWKLSFVERFDRPLNDDVWGLYEGQPGGDPGGWWDPSHVVVRDGTLRLETYRDPKFGNRWVSGGVSNSQVLKQRYGRYEVRFRMNAGRGVAGILLLWPVRDVWPPEIDFAENGGASATRTRMSATLHYDADNKQIQREVFADFTRWHTMGVRWTPGKLVYTIDGRTWGTVRSRHVPDEKMELAMQAQAGTCGDEYAPCPDETTPDRVTLEVDTVRAWAYKPRRSAR